MPATKVGVRRGVAFGKDEAVLRRRADDDEVDETLPLLRVGRWPRAPSRPMPPAGRPLRSVPSVSTSTASDRPNGREVVDELVDGSEGPTEICFAHAGGKLVGPFVWAAARRPMASRPAWVGSATLLAEETGAKSDAPDLRAEPDLVGGASQWTS